MVLAGTRVLLEWQDQRAQKATMVSKDCKALVESLARMVTAVKGDLMVTKDNLAIPLRVALLVNLDQRA